jgi:threonine dehydratase
MLPISLDDVRAARARIAPHLDALPTPARRYADLDALVGHGIRVVVKHENHLPTNAFKVRNGTSAITALSAEARARGVVAATTGNHGLGLAFAGQRTGTRVTICVPTGNNPEKNAAIRALGAELIEGGADYDAAIEAANRVVQERGATLVHSTNDRTILAGAGTMTLELLEQEPGLEALIIATGGGSQAVGAITVAQGLGHALAVYGVNSERASAQHDGWHAKRHASTETADTFAEGIATRRTYDLTFDTLRDGLAGFVTVTEAALAQAVRDLLRITHNLPEGTAGAGLAGLHALAPTLAGKTVGIVLCGGNLDSATLARILNGAM